MTTINSQAGAYTQNTGMTITGAMASNITGTVAANASQYSIVNANYNNIGIGQPISTTIPGSQYNISNGYTVGFAPPVSTVAFHNGSNQEVVRLNKDGSVTWASGINIDDAADAFAKSIQLGAERSAGITAGVKQRMRDTIFEEMIEMAKIKGTLDADELTYMLSAAKIMDKLKGKYE
jgi:hypothetical protein